MSHKDSSGIANMVKVEDNLSDSNETEIDFKPVQCDIKLEAEDVIFLDIKQEEIDIKDEVLSTSTFHSDGDEDVDNNSPPASFQKLNKKHEGIEDVFKSIQSDIQLEIKNETLMDIKQEEIDIKDEVPSTSTFHSDGDESVDDNAPPASFQKPNQKFVSSHKTKRDKLFVCNVCDYKSARKSHLTVHVRCHTGEKPFSCGLCDFKTAHKNSLKIHVTNHTGEKRFGCDSCDFKTAHKGYLSVHMTNHTGEKRFACGSCDFKTAHRKKLVRHMKRHTGQKPFACALCDFKSARKDKLTIHMRSHTGKKRFACGLCDFKTARKDNLTVHRRNHTGEKRFACSLCDFKNTRKNSLVRHMKKHL